MNRSDSSFPTQIAAAGEVLQAVGTAQQAVNSHQANSTDIASAGFSSGVHQYLNQLLTLIYSKTTTLLAANMVLISLLLSTRTSIKIQLDFFYVCAICSFSVSAITSVIVLFPRLHHHDANGLIFWRAILINKSAEDYNKTILTLDKNSVETEYAKDNYHIARTIRYKDALLRVAISAFIAGITCALIGVVGPMVFNIH